MILILVSNLALCQPFNNDWQFADGQKPLSIKSWQVRLRRTCQRHLWQRAIKRFERSHIMSTLKCSWFSNSMLAHTASHGMNRLILMLFHPSLEIRLNRGQTINSIDK